jgi:hypothetical protein
VSSLRGGVKIDASTGACNSSAYYWTKSAFVAQEIPNSIGTRVLFMFGPAKRSES